MNIVTISDLHCGCRLGLLPPEPIHLAHGLETKQNRLQKKLWRIWTEYWEWVHRNFADDECVLVVNGDAIDGDHHGSKNQISTNRADQAKIAVAVLKPQIERLKPSAFYMVGGTESHVGKSSEDEENVGMMLGAKKDDDGQAVRPELWLDAEGHLIHFAHHIGTTSSASYESTAVWKEMVEAYTEAGRWGQRAPDIVVRAHRHRYMQIGVSTADGNGISVVSAGWQGKTPFVFRTGGKQTVPQYGGVVVVAQKGEDAFVRHKTVTTGRSRMEVFK